MGALEVMEPRALSLRLQIAVQSRIRCSGVSGSMSQNRQLPQEAMPKLEIFLEPAVPSVERDKEPEFVSGEVYHSSEPG